MGWFCTIVLHRCAQNRQDGLRHPQKAQIVGMAAVYRTAIPIACPEKESAVFMKATQDALHSYIPDSLQVDVQLRVGRLPEEQYALGGCYLVFEHLFSRPKLALSLI